MMGFERQKVRHPLNLIENHQIILLFGSVEVLVYDRFPGARKFEIKRTAFRLVSACVGKSCA